MNTLFYCCSAEGKETICVSSQHGFSFRHGPIFSLLVPAETRNHANLNRISISPLTAPIFIFIFLFSQHGQNPSYWNIPGRAFLPRRFLQLIKSRKKSKVEWKKQLRGLGVKTNKNPTVNEMNEENRRGDPKTFHECPWIRSVNAGAQWEYSLKGCSPWEPWLSKVLW